MIKIRNDSTLKLIIDPCTGLNNAKDKTQLVLL